MVHIVSNKDISYQDFFARSLDDISSVIDGPVSIAIVAVGEDVEDVYSSYYECTPTTAYMLSGVIQQDAINTIIDREAGDYLSNDWFDK